MGCMRMTKLHEDKDNLVCKNEIRLASGQDLIIKNHLGFEVARITEAGNLRIKGEVIKT